MNKSIYNLQNTDIFLKCRLAQRKTYSKAKMILKIESIVMLVFILLSCLGSFLDYDILTMICSFFSIVVLVLNRCFDKNINRIKIRAADIQQYIDTNIYSEIIGNQLIEWGKIITKTDLSKDLNKYKNDDTKDFLNWYSDYSALDPNLQVFYCQRENIRWNQKTNKKYKIFYISIPVVFFLIFIIGLLVYHISFVKSMYSISYLIPIAEYVIYNFNSIKESEALLAEADKCADQIENEIVKSNIDVKDKLIGLQYKIYEIRIKGYLIPDWFYKLNRNKQQEAENDMSVNIVNLDTKDGNKIAKRD